MLAVSVKTLLARKERARAQDGKKETMISVVRNEGILNRMEIYRDKNNDDKS